MKKRLIPALALTLATTAILAIDATPASANWNDCYGGAMCLWQHVDSGGLMYTLNGDDSTLHNNPCDRCESSKHPGSNDTWGDQASSYFNKSSYDVWCLYSDTNFNGKVIRIQPMGSGNLSGDMNDEISSAKRC